jgi:subtilase family serine protease
LVESDCGPQAWPAAELWFLGAAQVLSAPGLPDAFSLSYGECERDIRGSASTPTTRASADLLDSMLVRLGLAGVGSFASAGDFGSTCDGQPFLGVTWPASSPYLTAVGVTRAGTDGGPDPTFTISPSGQNVVCCTRNPWSYANRQRIADA